MPRLELFICFDNDGDYSVDIDEDDAIDSYISNYGEKPFRLVKLVIDAPEIKRPVLELTATLPDEETELGEVKMTVSEIPKDT